MSKKKEERGGLLIILAIILGVIVYMDSWWKWVIVGFLVFAEICILFADKFEQVPKEQDDSQQNDTPEASLPGKPNFKIRYEKEDGEVSNRKITVKKFDGIMLDAYCFLRKERRSFLITRIKECIDLSTGELVTGDLMEHYAKNHCSEIIPSKVFRYGDWLNVNYSSFSKLPKGVHGFDLDEDLVIDFVSFHDGEIRGKFHCGKIKESSSFVDVYGISVEKDGKAFNVDFDKIISVEGVDDFGAYVAEKFANSDEGKACKLVEDFQKELLIFTYLGKADSSFSPKRRAAACDYLIAVGADCSDGILCRAVKKIKVDSASFKKNVNAYAKVIPDDKKRTFLDAAESAVGGRDKAKPFGLAGLQYIESKIKA